MSDFAGWTKRDGALWLDGYDDVWVDYSREMTCNPFIWHVGKDVCGSAPDLRAATVRASTTAWGRAVLLSDDPLPQTDEAADARLKFYAERGLT